MTPERKYLMTRIVKGDYLLPSNDAETLWRIVSYDEDGSAETWDGRIIKGEFWNLWRWDGGFPTDAALADSIELEDWTRWEHYAGGFKTRAAAVEEALRREGARRS